LTRLPIGRDFTIMPAVDRFLLDCAAAAIEVPLPRYMDWAFDALQPLLRFDSACWGIGTHDPPVTHLVHLRGVPPAMLIAYEAGIVELDYIRAAAAAAPGTTINDYDIRDAFPAAAAAIDDRISAPFAIEQTLATSLPHDATGGLQHLVLLWRAKRFDPFDEAERALVERCVPHMVAGYRTAQRLFLATTAAREAARGQALVDARGFLHSFDDRFVRIVRRQWPDWGDGGLPEPLAQAVAAGGDSSLPGLDVKARAGGPLWAVSLAERRIDPLTPAQRRVAELYAGGMTHRQIAAALGLAPATVRNQVARTFARLGVDNKLALAERLRSIG
jgi:DNA-binding CsgD family transcriptional regulator